MKWLYIYRDGKECAPATFDKSQFTIASKAQSRKVPAEVFLNVVALESQIPSRCFPGSPTAEAKRGHGPY
jgi:hypothetical protein